MTDSEWDDWAGYHATLHRMTDAADLAMMSLWRDVFEASGYGADELREASIALATSGEGRWRSEHLESLIQRVTQRRFQRMQLEQAELDQQHAAEECRQCSGSGLVTVPHPHCVRDGDFCYPFYTCVVACMCYRGERKRQQNMATRSHHEEKVKARRIDTPAPSVLPSIAEWELRHPGWQSLLEQREYKREVGRKARMATAAADSRRGPLLIGQVLGELQ